MGVVGLVGTLGVVFTSRKGLMSRSSVIAPDFWILVGRKGPNEEVDESGAFRFPKLTSDELAESGGMSDPLDWVGGAVRCIRTALIS